MDEISSDHTTWISLEWICGLDPKAREQAEATLERDGWKLDPTARVYRPSLNTKPNTTTLKRRA